MEQSQQWDAIRAAVAAHKHAALDDDGKMAAAVLIALAPYDTGPHVVFQVRSFDVEHHKGEISFPGGAKDPTDANLAACALRESHEELGIHPSHVDLLGEMSHYITHTGFHVTPFVGILDRAPYPYVASEIEVAQVLDVPLSHLLDEANWSHQIRERDDTSFTMRPYHWGEHTIWGATAMMLQTFLSDVASELSLEH